MKRRLDGFILIGLGICFLMTLFISPFASSDPDGLEKVAETKGFAERGESWKFWQHAPLPDYDISWVRNKRISTALSGVIGTVAIFLLTLGIGKSLKKSSMDRTPKIREVKRESIC